MEEAFLMITSQTKIIRSTDKYNPYAPLITFLGRLGVLRNLHVEFHHPIAVAAWSIGDLEDYDYDTNVDIVMWRKDETDK